MKKNIKLTALLLCLIFALATCVGAGTAFASEVSTTDASATVSASDTTAQLANYPLRKMNIDAYQLSMLVPELDVYFSIDGTDEDVSAALSSYGITNLESVINYTDYYGNSYTHIYNGNSSDSNVSMYIIYNKNNYTEFIGSYDRLDDKAMESVRSSNDILGSGTECNLMNIHGTTFLYQESTDASLGTYSVGLKSIINGGEYQFCIYLTNPTEADYVAVNKIVDSIKLGGVKYSNVGIANNTLVVVLLVCCIVLLIVAALLAFLIFRFSKFQTAAGSKFNIIGFNLPPKYESEDDCNEDDYYDDNDSDDAEEISDEE